MTRISVMSVSAMSAARRIIPWLGAILVCLGAAGSAPAGMVVATFQEQWFSNQTNNMRDLESDLWSIHYYGSPGEKIQIKSVAITLDQNNVFDDTSAAPGISKSFPFKVESGSTTSLSSSSVSADSKTLTLNFNSFTGGDVLNFSIDVDDNNAVVRGTNGGVFGDMLGASVLLTLNNNGVTQLTSFLFSGPLTPPSSGFATGSVEVTPLVSIAAVPEPSTLLGGILGVALVGGNFLRRRRSRS